MADEIQFNFDDNTTPVYNSGNKGKPASALEFNFDHETELQNHTDDEAEATDIVNNKLGFGMDAKYRWDLHKYQNLREELTWDILNGRKKKEDARSILQNRQTEIQDKYGLNTFNSEETSPYAFKLGKFTFDIGGGIDQIFQQLDIGQEMLNPRSIPAGILSFGVRFAQNQKITAAGAALGGVATAPIGGEGAAPGAAVGETIATAKTIAETFNDVRNTAVFFDTASKEGTDFFYQAYVENGVPLEDAKNAAMVVGIINGGAEVWSQDILAAPFKKAGSMIGKGVEKKAAQTSAKLIAEAVKKDAFKEGVKAFGKQFGATVASETATELLQEASQIAAENETGQIDLKDPAQRQKAIDRLTQTGISTVAATMILGGISGGMEVNNKRIELAREKINGPEVQKEVSAKILTKEEAAQMEAEANANGSIEGNNSNGTAENAPEGNGAGNTMEPGKEGKNAGDGKIDLPNVLTKLKPEERAVVNKQIKTLDSAVKKSDKEIKVAEKEYEDLQKEGKSTKAIEKKLEQLHDNKDFAKAELEDIKSGKRSVADISSEQIKTTPDKTLQMRKDKVAEDIKNVKEDIKAAEKARKMAKLSGKNETKVLENLDSLNKKLDELDNEKAMIESGGLSKEDYRLPDAPTKGQVDLQRYRKQKVQELQNGITNYVKGVKTGSTQQRVETKQIHQNIEGMLREAGVRINEKGQFASLIKNTQTIEQLEKNTPQIIQKIKDVFEDRNKKAAMTKLGKFKKLAKNANITADTRSRMNYLLGLTKINNFDSGMMQKSLEDIVNNGERNLTEAEIKQLADLQLASGLRDSNGRLAVSSKEIEQLNKELEHLVATGRTLRQEHLEKVKQAKIDNINGAIDAISKSKFTNNKLMDMYNRSIANIGSLLNSLGGKEFAEKFDPEYQQGKLHEAIYAKNKDIRSTGEKIFNVDKYKLEKKFQEMSENKFFLTLQTDADIKHVPRQVSTWHLLDIYNSLKNEDIAQDYYDAYGQDQLMSLLGNLTREEMQYGDYMQSLVQGYYSVANEYNKLKTGKELPKRNNFWMATSDMMNKEYNALDSYRPIASVPSFLKEKQKHTTPIPYNAMQKMYKHISQAEYLTHLEPTYVNLHNIFSDKNVRNLVEQKFNKNIVNLLDKEIEELSLNGRMQTISDFERVMNKLVGKWAVAKVANPGVGVKQLAASVNYATEMPVASWAKHFAGALLHPKKTFDFMVNNSKLIETRYGSGYDDAVALAISGAEGASKGEQILTEALLSFTKMGDIGAIIYGGNAYVRYRMEQGDSVTEAIKKFENISNKTQQSNNPSSMSQLQKGRGVNFFMKFRNTANQYARLVVDAQVQYMRGEISQLQHAKIIGMYMVVQPLLYTYIGAAMKDAGVQVAALFGGPTDDKKEVGKLETFLDAMNMMVGTVVEALPVVDELVDHALRSVEPEVLKQFGVTVDMPMYDMFKAQMLSDVAKGIKILNTQLPRIGNEDSKKPFNLAKTIYGFGLIQEPLTRVPVKLLFDTADIFSGGKVHKAMDKHKKKDYTKKKKSDSMFEDSENDMFQERDVSNNKKDSMFADSSGDMFAK